MKQQLAGSLFALLALWCPSALGAVLEVGPGKPYALPSQAIAAASPGDTIDIAPGTYQDCAAWNKDNLTVQGSGDGTVITTTICQGAGILVDNAPNATVRNLTLSGASSSEGNGSGIRANGLHLTIDACTFRDNQDGVLTANNPEAVLVIRNSVFERNGACLPNKGCAHGVYAGHIGLLHIENSWFSANKVGHHIKSRARRTELIGNTIEDGSDGTSSYLVNLPNGGALVMTGNKLEKGPMSQNPTAAVSIGEEGGNRPAAEMLIAGNVFRNDGVPTVFVRNRTKQPVRLRDNQVEGPAQLLTGPGTTN